MRELRIAVIDDDYFKREHMAQELDRSPHIAVVHAIDQDEAIRWPLERWEELDYVLVDVFDEYAPGEVGTDMYSGIGALDRLKDVGVKTIAITPHRHHPLVEQRIYQAKANFLYRRWEVNDLDHLENVLLNPDRNHQPQPVSNSLLRKFGAHRANTNAAVGAYERSRLHGVLMNGITKRGTRLTRRTVDGFVAAIQRTGFRGPTRPYRSIDGIDTSERVANRGAHWKSIRDYVMVLIGRRDAPPSNADNDHLI